MSRQWFTRALTVGALMVAMPLLANQGKGHGKGNPHNNEASDRDDRDDAR